MRHRCATWTANSRNATNQISGYHSNSQHTNQKESIKCIYRPKRSLIVAVASGYSCPSLTNQLCPDLNQGISSPEKVFSTYLFHSHPATQEAHNSIDLSYPQYQLQTKSPAEYINPSSTTALKCSKCLMHSTHVAIKLLLVESVCVQKC